MKRLLIHTCCAPCFTYIHDDITIYKELFKNSVDITALWYNPNIQPKEEYNRRKNTLVEYCKLNECKLEIIDEYDIKDFLKNTINLENRCYYCYYLRLNKLFEYAKSNSYDMVMTTLSISPYQNQELLKKIGSELEKKYNIEYIQLDYTLKFREGQKKAMNLNLYRQKYCGCVLSIDNGKWEY